MNEDTELDASYKRKAEFRQKLERIANIGQDNGRLKVRVGALEQEKNDLAYYFALQREWGKR
jgi:hypothetical protein